MLSHGLCIPTEQSETLSESSVSASSPSHIDMTFDQADPTASIAAVIPVLSSTLGRNFFTTTGSSATSHASQINRPEAYPPAC
ncbi:MAG: hypothetical protein Q9M17_01925 [Mariprofundus sp.]|nr:hypothetical protein [Mariprofundus sp.]